MKLQYNMNKVLSSMEEPTVITKEDFIGYLFKIRNDAHLLHLASRSYSEHISLQNLYSKIENHVDRLVETAQTDKLMSIEIPCSNVAGTFALDHIKDCLQYVCDNRYTFTHSFQQAIIDDVEELLSSTIYKLTFLK